TGAAGIVFQVIVTVWQGSTALAQLRDHHLYVLTVLAYIEAKHRGSGTCATQRRYFMQHTVHILYTFDALQISFDRGIAELLDGSAVHGGGIEVAPAAFYRTGRCACFSSSVF